MRCRWCGETLPEVPRLLTYADVVRMPWPARRSRQALLAKVMWSNQRHQMGECLVVDTEGTYSVSEAAKVLSRSRHTLYRMCYQGILPRAQTTQGLRIPAWVVEEMKEKS